jgi:hypothetical protein
MVLEAVRLHPSDPLEVAMTQDVLPPVTEDAPVTLRPGITVCIAAHPVRFRNGLLGRAFASVCKQTYQPDEILVLNDSGKQGAGWTRRELVKQVRTEWIAWLDSDDYWYPNHLQDLVDVAKTDPTIKYVFSWFDGRNDPLGHFGKVYDIHNPHHTTITALVDTAMAQEVSYPDTAADWPVSNEDLIFIFDFAKLCVARDLKMVHLPKKTWYWEQAGQNTSGKPDKGDAA